MTMIEVNSVDAVPGEAELLAVAVDPHARTIRKHTTHTLTHHTHTYTHIPPSEGVEGLGVLVPANHAHGHAKRTSRVSR